LEGAITEDLRPLETQIGDTLVKVSKILAQKTLDASQHQGSVDVVDNLTRVEAIVNPSHQAIDQFIKFTIAFSETDSNLISVLVEALEGRGGYFSGSRNDLMENNTQYKVIRNTKNGFTCKTTPHIQDDGKLATPETNSAILGFLKNIIKAPSNYVLVKSELDYRDSADDSFGKISYR